MSLLLLSHVLKNKQNKLPGLVSSDIDNESSEVKSIKRNRLWLLTYIALFTSLLAFFILIISLVELEGSTPKRNYQKLVNQLYRDVLYQRNQQAIPWLQVENTLTKGVRLTLPADLVSNSSLFASARAQINPRYLPYLQSVAELLQRLNVDEFRNRNAKLIRGIETPGTKVKFMIRIEGHTDSQPMAASARFKNNVELSTFRAYAMMEWMRIHTGLARDHFAISGYGSFHPLTSNAQEPENRRIEIYLIPQLIDNPAAVAVENELERPR
ncbi:chemotaxis protein MotB [Thiomicrorhabdus immobilis]|uniref:Chemotaxis protein MotB n=1 Tax=Thiomicrorhabdus immobilis TaxID=2791037 RepID=A0ABN6CUI9_9GAMM|nr:OmpA family protein [Thiomicrorhabdus immobilis]BCN92636.1 chemotaxis protein MotB [Thiomicrorhabdus immobilis]